MSKAIDALIVVHVMGWADVSEWKEGDCSNDNCAEGYCHCDKNLLMGYHPTITWTRCSVPRYSNSRACAWEVIEKMNCEVQHSMVFKPDGKKHMFWFRDACSGWQDSYPRAICIAALKAKGIEVPNEKT